MVSLLILLLFNVCDVHFLHPFYVSVTDIHYKKEEKSIQVAQRLFWDDLEVALTEYYREKIDILKEIPKDRLEIMMSQYLIAHNLIRVNGKQVSLNYIGHEIDEDAIWFYLEGKLEEHPRHVVIINSVLTDYFDEQKNIVNFYMDKKPKSIVTNKKKKKGELFFGG